MQNPTPPRYEAFDLDTLSDDELEAIVGGIDSVGGGCNLESILP